MKLQIALVFCLLSTFLLHAEEKKIIQVKFTITENQYRSVLGPKIDFIETECSLFMVEHLNQTFGFFKFTLEEGSNVLSIKLDDKEQNPGSNSNLIEVGQQLHISNTQEDLGQMDPVYWVFRSVEEYFDPLPELKEDLVEQINQNFTRGIHDNKEEVVRNLLSKVELTNEFQFIDEIKMYIIPVVEEEYNIATNSEFQIITTIRFGIGEMNDIVSAKALTCVDDIALAIEKYHLPSTYSDGSLLLIKKGNTGSETLDNIIIQDSTNKRIFIVKHLPLGKKGTEIITP